MEEISGKNVVVTGGANGLGFNYTQELLRNEAKVYCYQNISFSFL